MVRFPTTLAMRCGSYCSSAGRFGVPRPPARHGFTLIELLVTIAIVGVLVSMLLPVVLGAREAGRRIQCQNQLYQIGLATRQFVDARNEYPGGAPAVLTSPTLSRTPRDQTTFDVRWGWAYEILPYTDDENRFDNPSDAAVIGHAPNWLHCPNRTDHHDAVRTDAFENTIALSDYVGNGCSQCDLTAHTLDTTLAWQAQLELDGVFLLTRLATDPIRRYAGRRRFDVKDGDSNTICVAEKRVLAAPTACNDSLGWVSGFPVQHQGTTYGLDTLFSGVEGGPASDVEDLAVTCTSRAGGPHTKGGAPCGNVLFCDGSVRLINLAIDTDVWRAGLSVAGREDVEIPSF